MRKVYRGRNFKSPVASLNFCNIFSPTRRYGVGAVKCCGNFVRVTWLRKRYVRAAVKVKEVQREIWIVNNITAFQRTRTETMFQCEQLWQNTASPQNHTCIWNTTNVCTFTTDNVLKLFQLSLRLYCKQNEIMTHFNCTVRQWSEGG
jgi:hypothetical protein